MRVLWVAFLAAMVAALPARDGDTQIWNALAVSGPAKEDSRLLLWFDGHARFRDAGDGLAISIIRPGIGWRVNENIDVWGGYARVTAHNVGINDISIGEDRIWQQATYKIAPVLGGTLSGRTRVEQRFSELAGDTGHRVRQFFKWSRPINEDFSFIVWDEVFIGFNDTSWGNLSGYQQNRAFVGVGYSPVNKVRFEAGYLNNNLESAAGGNSTNHNISFALVLGL